MVSGVLSRCYLSLLLGAALAAPLAAAEPPVRTRGEEFQANATFLGDQFNPAVASQPGRSMVVWVDEFQGLQGRVFDDLGRSVSPELTVDGGVAIPQIAADAYGGFLVAWVKPYGTSVMAQRYDANGEPLGPRLTIYSASSHPSPSSNESLLDIGLVSRGTEGFLVAWTSVIAASYRILMQELDALGRPRAGAFQVSQQETGFRVRPGIAVQPSGEAMVTWIDGRESGNPDVWARRVFAAGQPQGPEFRVEANNAGYAVDAVPVAHDDGGFSVVWSDGDSVSFSKFTVAAQRFDTSGSRSGPLFLLTESASEFSRPAVAAGPDGNLLVLWGGFELDPDGGIMGRFFSPSWQPLGDIFRVNTFLQFIQSSPAIAADGRGGFTAAWTSVQVSDFQVAPLPGQDGSGSGVFGQQLAAPAPVPCARGSRVLCLGENGRFEVRVSWTRPGGESGTGKAQPLAADTGALWFFGEDNLELLIKVLDGRIVNGHFWVYYGALSDVDYTITVTDTRTGAEKTYHNPQGRLASRADVQAFPDAASIAAEIAQAAVAPVVSRSLPPPLPATAIGAAAACQPSTEGLCLNQGRFLVEVEAVDPRTNSKVRARAVPLTGDTGAFWFFGADNLELMIKVLDGRGVNGRFWVYYGALSDVRYTITVTDTATQEKKTYENAPGRLVSRADVEAF
ncbi:MAG TPA: hypothetical protein VF789_08980 [Thermoanaerobaculia bacterium]